MNEDIHGAIEFLLDLGRKTGQISKSDLDRACSEFNVTPSLLSHWFQKRFNMSWESYRLETQREQEARVDREAETLAKNRFERHTDRFSPHLAMLNAHRSRKRNTPAFYFVGLVKGGVHYEIVDVGTKEVSTIRFDQLRKSAPDLARRILDENIDTAIEIARQRVASDPKRYRYGTNKAGLIDGRKKWCYIAMRYDDIHELISLEDFLFECLEWSDIYEISYSFVREIQS